MDIGKYKQSRYDAIIEIICNYKGISKEQLSDILRDRECKYLLFLLLEKYKCTELDYIRKDLRISTKKSIRNNVKKAEEKFFINREFREKYLELEKIAQKIL
ncbi:ribose-5-phosphate isomerase [Clostridium thermarum]|uniref:ribose-5-phosphate isomerase n=1 Tax=Clostridium thermarum TaxID=1716543 RepID=UPI0013D0CB74|nr:ribose-5-phosphate isomerase [Clostridium thermarum]